MAAGRAMLGRRRRLPRPWLQPQRATIGSVSNRLRKNDETLSTPGKLRLDALRFSSTALYGSTEKINVTLTLMPSARLDAIAGRAASVAGVLMKMFGLSTSHRSPRASDMSGRRFQRCGRRPRSTRPSRRLERSNAQDVACRPDIPRSQKTQCFTDNGTAQREVRS